MKIILQRVNSASVKVDGKITGEIRKGYLLFVGIGKDDNEEKASALASKIVNLRIFSDENDKINLSLKDVGGEILSVSQFTLYADCHKGNRPSFVNAMPPVEAEKLYNFFCDECYRLTGKIQKGIFGADMKVELINDGPFTLCLEI